MQNVTYEFNGYTVEFKPYLTFGQKRALEKLMAGGIHIDPTTNKQENTISGAIMYESQDFVLRALIVSLKTPDGLVFQGDQAYEAIQNFTPDQEEIGRAIYTKINEVTRANNPSADKKKVSK